MLKIVAGLLTPSAGRVMFQGAEVVEPSRDMGFMFQAPVLLPWRTVERNVMLPAEVFQLKDPEVSERVREAIGLVGLGEFSQAMPKQLSGGMQQRVALARVLAYRPKLLLMDEPFGALDAQTRALMGELLLRVWEDAAKTVLFVTHDIEEALFLADRVFVMTARPGRIREEIQVPLPRPRTVEMLTSETFVALKRRVMQLIREEALRTLEVGISEE